jgi:hypothetical protein
LPAKSNRRHLCLAIRAHPTRIGPVYDAKRIGPSDSAGTEYRLLYRGRRVCHIAATIKMTVLVRDAVIVLTLRPFASVQRKRSTQRSRLTFHGLLRHCRVHVNVTRDHIRIRYPLQVSRQVALSQWLPERRTTGPRSSGHVVGPAVAVVLFFFAGVAVVLFAGCGSCSAENERP